MFHIKGYKTFLYFQIMENKIETEFPSQSPSQIESSQEKEIVIKRQFFKSYLNRQVDSHGSKNTIESDSDFIYQLLKIVEKHQYLTEEVTYPMKSQTQEISDELCTKIHEMATRHAAANRFNVYSELQSSSIPKEKLCKCGCGKAQGHALPFCSNEVSQYFFGPAIILFFFFLRKIGLLILFGALIYGVFNLASNITSSPKLTDQCAIDAGSLSFLCQYKLISTVRNKSSNEVLMNIQVWLGFVLCVCWVFGLRIIRNMGRTLNRKVDDYLDSSSDYVIQISNLPFEDYTEKQILKYIARLWKKYKGKGAKPISIKSVQIVYRLDEARQLIKSIIAEALKVASNLEEFVLQDSQKSEQEQNEKNIINSGLNQNKLESHFIEELKREKSQMIQQKNQNFTEIQETISRVAPPNKVYKIKTQNLELYALQKARLIELLNQMEHFRQNFINDSEFRKKMATDMAFIQFTNSQQQTQFLKEIRQYRLTILGQIKEYIVQKIFPSQDSLLFKGSNIRITRAPEPSDIHWGNCEKKFSYRRVLLVWLFTFAILGLSFGVLIFIGFLRKKFPALNSISILISISLQLFNRIIWNALVSFVDLEQNNTKTDNIISVMTKSSFAAAINVIVLPILTNIVLKDNLYGPEGLIGIVLDFQFMVFFMMINFNVINVPYQIKRIGLCIPFIRNRIIRSKANIIGQLDTSEDIKSILQYYEPPPFPVAAAYFYITTITYQTIFFCHLQPTLIFYLLFNIGCFYLVLKYLLIRRCKIPELFDFLIFETSFTILQYVPLFYGIGSLMFVQLIGNGSSDDGYAQLHFRTIPSFLCIILWLFAMFNPKSIMNKITKSLMTCFTEEKQKNLEESQLVLEEENNQAQSQGIFPSNSQQNKQKIIIKMETEDLEDNKISKRRECYYQKCGLNDLLNYEAELMEIKDEKQIKSTKFVKVDGIVNLNKLFCERFHINPVTNTPEQRTNKLFKSKKLKKLVTKVKKLAQKQKPMATQNCQKANSPKQTNLNGRNTFLPFSAIAVKPKKKKLEETQSQEKNSPILMQNLKNRKQNLSQSRAQHKRGNQQSQSGLQLKGKQDL